MKQQSKFPKVNIKGKGSFKTPPSKPLDKSCKPGEIVTWGDNIGELIEWEGPKAFIKTPQGVSAVEVA
jgi:hypothetical protein